MKKIITVLVSVLMTIQVYPCSCQPWNVNFFDNIKPASTVGLFRIDSIWSVTDTSTLHEVPMAKLSVIKSYSLTTLNAGDTATFFGQDGVNCAEGFNQFNLGDTILASIHVGNPFQSPHQMHFIPFWSPTGCGTHYIVIKNKAGIGKPLDELENELIDQYLSGIDQVNQNKIIISPNPVGNDLFIQGLKGIPDKIIVYNMEGKIMATAIQNDNGGLNVSNLEKGIYFLEIIQGQQKLTSRFVKL